MVPVASIGDGISLNTCPELLGAEIQIAVNQRAHVPDSVGETITNSTLGIDFFSETTVSTINDIVTVEHFEADVDPTVPTIPDEPVAPDGSPKACSQTLYGVESRVEHGWSESPKWGYNVSSEPGYLQPDAALPHIRAAVQHVYLANTNCTWNLGHFNIGASYQGTTTRIANITQAHECGPKFPNGYNTVSWGPIDDNVIAETCVKGDAYYHMTEADILIGSNHSTVANLSNSCVSQVDLESVMTHEWGHAFGLAHVLGDANNLQTMYPTTYTCSTIARTLAMGDLYGMQHIYGTQY